MSTYNATTHADSGLHLHKTCMVNPSAQHVLIGSPGGQISLIQDVLMRRLVVIHKVAVGHVSQVLAVAVLTVVRRHHAICDEIWQE